MQSHLSLLIAKCVVPKVTPKLVEKNLLTDAVDELRSAAIDFIQLGVNRQHHRLVSVGELHFAWVQETYPRYCFVVDVPLPIVTLSQLILVVPCKRVSQRILEIRA